jgi:acyl-coenzyme A synthetase/AMP-(fatty) acid ligase
MSHSSVVDCAAVAYFCETEKAWLPRAFAMLTDHSDLDLDSVRKEVLEIVETKLPDEKQLRGGLFLVKDLPRTATGKINRRDLLKYDVSICL